MSLTAESPQVGTATPAVLYEFFERTVRSSPDAVAVDVPPGPGRPQRRTISYAELKQAAERLARAVHLAVGRGGVAAVLLRRTSERLYAAQLAVLRSACAYVCVDPAFPDDQVAHILSDSSAGALLTDAEGAERASKVGYAGPIIRVDRPLDSSAADLPAPPNPEDVAYLIYTSGSTGRPKGVLVPHQGIVNLISGDLIEFGLGPGDRVAQGSSAAYDSSVEEVWMALASGATVVVLDDDTARLGPDLVRWLREERITVLCPPPTLLRATGCPDPERELPELRLLYVGGEALPEDVAERWSRGRRMVNGYGPTECTVTCLRQDIVAGEKVAIGRPVPGMRAWVLDENLDPVPSGEKGELCLGGAGVALGYLGRPELTAEKFPTHPRLGRIYRTGDLVHVEPDGTFFYHGRIDSQVKLRGYRIELEAIEACLARCPGVREAACRVQGEGATQTLAAHVIPEDPSRLPHVEDLKRRLREQLPGYMVPSVFGAIDEFPRTAGGKLRRSELPILSAGGGQPGPAAAPRNPVEQSIAEAVRRALELPAEPSVDADFFTDLGGSSLTAAMVITELRADPATASITVRDLYQARTIGELARRAAPPTDAPETPQRERATGNPARATAAQALWLLLELIAGSAVAYFAFFWVFAWISDSIGLVTLILVAPVALTALQVLASPLSVSVAVRAKKLLIGRYTPARAPAWSGFHVRMWIVRQFTRLIPWATIAGTEFQCMALRALGARIGKRVHIHRGVNLTQGGWDMLYIGDDVTISQDASVGLVHLERGEVVLGPVTLADGATLDIRAGVGPNTRVGQGSWLTALSSLPSGSAIPDGERWDGIPAQPAGAAPTPPAPPERGRRLSPLAHGVAMILAQNLLRWALSLPYTVVFALIAYRYDLSYETFFAALADPAANLPLLAAIGAATCLSVLLMVALEAVACRLLGQIRPGVISRWSPGYIRVWLKTGLVASAGRWLSGGLFWPTWLRAAGMRIGRGCEISTIIDVVPEMVRIDRDTFFADGIYLGGPRVQRGTVTVAPVELGTNTFLGNHAVIAAGQRLPENILIGISTVADDRLVRPGTSWFGHPPFELPQREVVTVDRRLTHDPPLIRVVTRVFWEWLRFALPLGPALAAGLWTFGVVHVSLALPLLPLVLLGLPAVSLATGAWLCLVVLALKWGLLGKVREGIHPLWSCWCSRWDFLYVAWGVIASRVLAALEGTLLLPVYLRLMGMKIGRRVLLGDGFAQVVDPDMLHLEDGSTVSAMFQAHTFEDRVLKIAPVRVGAHATLGAATVPLYGADIGERAVVTPHSVVMKQERLLPGLRYAGAPTRRLDSDGTETLGGVRHARRHELGFPHWAVQPVITGAGKHRAPRSGRVRR
ncbi:non-ribosomal peptide synthetase [Gandjariella thermophila]|uniref:Amino acid adenylation protein n=1 Tax=Gandjariella thermophila TaxID=1931992 RepID=A0A4D4J4V8_9PSEU|nr:non-ribosomal peptide synthetase [Gandjariella thermophila]GDY28993.1 amino acid adenylation protein [Gandjariella thermophila]